VVAGAFVFSDLVMMKYLAFGLLIALLLDATIVRMFLVPAIMKLLGDDCWWAPKWMKRLQHKIGLGETTLPDERKLLAAPEPEVALVGAAAAPAGPVSTPRQRIAAVGTAALLTEPVSAPVEEAPTTRFASTAAREDRDIGSWLGELRRKTAPRRPAAADHGTDSAEPTNVLASGEPTNVISAPDDATRAIPTANTGDPLSAEETRAIPVSRPQAADSEVATEQLNARGQHSGGGVSAQDLLRREGRI
jgi:RND superfamily putative drug exporter